MASEEIYLKSLQILFLFGEVMESKSQRLKCMFGHHTLKAKADVIMKDNFCWGWYITVNCDCCGITIAYSGNMKLEGFTEDCMQKTVQYINENNKIPIDARFLYGQDVPY